MYGSKEFYYKDKLLKPGSKYPGIDMGTKILCVENKYWAGWLHYNFTSSFSFPNRWRQVWEIQKKKGTEGKKETRNRRREGRREQRLVCRDVLVMNI